MSGLLDQLLNLNALLVYLLVGLIVFAEDALFIGFVLPGETAAVLGGVDASRGHVHLGLIMGVVVVAAIAGDSVGYEVGRHFGPRLLDVAMLRRHKDRVDDAYRFLAARGGTAVFLGRFVAFFRAVMPALAGSARMPYPRFLTFNAAGGLTWGIMVVLLGFLAGNSYKTVEKIVGRSTAAVLAGLVVVAVLVWQVRRHRGRAKSDSGHS